MTRWTWHAQDHSGRTCSGEVSASSNQAALQQVRNLGVYAAQVYAINSKPQVTSQQAPSNKRHQVSGKQVLWLTQQLAFLCAAGLPLLTALVLLRGQTLPAALTGVIDQLHHDLQQGLTLPKAFEAQSHIFPSAYVGTLQAAHGSGLLGEAFSRLAIQLAFKARLHAQVRSALSYPLLLLVLTLLIVSALLLLIVPTFEMQFASQGLSLPWPTQVLLRASRWLTAYAGLVAVVVTVTAVVLHRWIRVNQATPSKRFQQCRLWWHTLLVHTPVLGPWLWRIIGAQWAQCCAQLLASGLPLLEALAHARATVANTQVQAKLHTMRLSIESGVALSLALQQEALFEANLWAVCAVGEATGDMAQALNHASTMLEVQCTQQLKVFTSLLEPVAVVVVGAVIGAIVLAMYWPIFELGRTV